MAETTGLRIDQLPKASAINPADLLVLQQENTAKKVEGQLLLAWLTAAADGHGGISSINPAGSDGLVDFYTIILADATSFTFGVTNGAKGDKGDKGEKGDPPALVSHEVAYQVSQNGSSIPTGAWSETVPDVQQGFYLWTRVTQTFETGEPVIFYTVSRVGLDGLGAVSSVAGIAPLPGGDVPLTPNSIGALPTAGGKMTGPISMGGNRITNLLAPENEEDAATKMYVDNNSIRVVPLWVNGSPQESFSEDTPIVIDDQYDYDSCIGVFVDYLASVGGSTHATSGLLIKDGNPKATFYHTSYGTIFRRACNVSAARIKFGSGYSGETKTDTAMVPYAIYGVQAPNNDSLPVWSVILEMIGSLADLETSNKSSIVAAINEVIGAGFGGGVSETRVIELIDAKLGVIENGSY